MRWGLNALLAAVPWVTRTKSETDLAAGGALTLDGGSLPGHEQVTLIGAAVRTWGWALAAATPGAPLTGEVLYWAGRQLGLRGKATLAIMLEGEAATLLPYAATRKGDQWTGSVTLPDGNTAKHDTEDGGVVHLVLAGGAPIGAGDSAASLAVVVDAAAATEASIPPGHAINMGEQMARAGKEVRDQIAATFGAALARSGLVVMPPGAEHGQHYGPEPSAGLVALREQVRNDIEAAFGITGLLQPLTGRDSGPAAWRLAIVRTFNPLASMVEVEASAKLETEIRLNRDAWIPASHLDLARAAALRSQAANRLVQAGFSNEDAARLAGLDQ